MSDFNPVDPSAARVSLAGDSAAADPPVDAIDEVIARIRAGGSGDEARAALLARLDLKGLVALIESGVSNDAARAVLLGRLDLDQRRIAAAAVPAAAPKRGGRLVRSRRVLLPVGAAVGLAAVVLTVVQAIRLRDEHAADAARRQAIVTATNYAVDLTTYDFSHLDAEFQKVLDNSTGSFRTEYTAASASLRDLIAKFKATASGKVLETAVVTSDTSRATVLLFVDQTVTNTNSTTPRVDRSRMKMGLEKHGSKWLISSLDLL